MSNQYTRIINKHPDKFKPILCDRCREAGYTSYGECPTCLKNYAAAKEYLETHTIITDDELRDYHSYEHEDIKSILLRMPDEHPNLYFGPEVEVSFYDDEVRVPNDDDDDYYDDDDDEPVYSLSYIVEEITRISNGQIVCERDSSLTNGIELIFRAASTRYWMQPKQVKMVQDVFEFLKYHGAYTEQPDGNGMHVHVSQAFFKWKDGKQQDPTQALQNFNWYFQEFQPEIEKLGGRKYTIYCRSKADNAKNDIESTLRNSALHIKNAKIECALKRDNGIPNCDHGAAVTLSGQTIEARVFKSTLDYKQFYANLELVRNFAHAARENVGKVTLDNILHTKDNLYLDEHIQRTRMKTPKEPLALTKENTEELTFTIERNE